MPGAPMQGCRACDSRGVAPNVLTGNPVVCPLCQGSGKCEPNFLRLPFWYIIAPTSAGLAFVSASAAVTGSLQIDSRADFEWIWCSSTQTGTFTDELIDTSGRPYQNLAVNNANRWGTIQLPMALIVPVILPARSQINWKVTDTSVASNTIQLALAGYELYAEAQPPG